MNRVGSDKDQKVVRWAAPEARTLFKNLVLLDALVSDYELVIALVVQADETGIAELDRRLALSFVDGSRRFDILRHWLKLVDPLREALRSGRVDLRRDLLERRSSDWARTCARPERDIPVAHCRVASVVRGH